MGDNFNTQIHHPGTSTRLVQSVSRRKTSSESSCASEPPATKRLSSSTTDKVQYRNSDVNKKIAAKKRIFTASFHNKYYYKDRKGLILKQIDKQCRGRSLEIQESEFFSGKDLDLLYVLDKGEYSIYGLKIQFVRQHPFWSPEKYYNFKSDK